VSALRAAALGCVRAEAPTPRVGRHRCLQGPGVIQGQSRVDGPGLRQVTAPSEGRHGRGARLLARRAARHIEQAVRVLAAGDRAAWARAAGAGSAPLRRSAARPSAGLPAQRALCSVSAAAALPAGPRAGLPGSTTPAALCCRRAHLARRFGQARVVLAASLRDGF